MIQITDLEKYYKTDEVQTIALNKLSFEVIQTKLVRIFFTLECAEEPASKIKVHCGSFSTQSWTFCL